MRQLWGVISLLYLNNNISLQKETFIFIYNLQITAEGITEVGDPKVAICNAVEKLDIQLLVVGSHGRGAVTRLVIIYYNHLLFRFYRRYANYEVIIRIFLLIWQDFVGECQQLLCQPC